MSAASWQDSGTSECASTLACNRDCCGMLNGELAGVRTQDQRLKRTCLQVPHRAALDRNESQILSIYFDLDTIT